MKATGIVRRIDDLGRVVIPKEIRRTQHIRQGDPLEIYVGGEGQVIFKKYSPLGELNDCAGLYAEVLAKACRLRRWSATGNGFWPPPGRENGITRTSRCPSRWSG